MLPLNNLSLSLAKGREWLKPLWGFIFAGCTPLRRYPFTSCPRGTKGNEWKSLQSEWQPPDVWTDICIGRFPFISCGHHTFWCFTSLSSSVTMATRTNMVKHASGDSDSKKNLRFYDILLCSGYLEVILNTLFTVLPVAFGRLLLTIMLCHEHISCFSSVFHLHPVLLFVFWI